MSITGLSVYAQSLILIYNGKELVNGGTLKIDYVDPVFEYMRAAIAVKNIGDKDLNVHVQKRVKTLLSGSSNSFCWGTQCYSESAAISEKAVNIQSKSTDNSFLAEYFPAQKDTGRTIIEYLFFDAENSANSAKVTVSFLELKTAICELETGEFVVFHNASPERTINVSYHLTAKSKLVLYSLSGQISETFDLNSGKSDIQLPVKSGNGIYLYAVVRNEKVIRTGKLCVM